MLPRYPPLLAPALTCLIALGIVATTLTPAGAGPPPFLTDKQAHALAFALLVLPLGLTHPHRWLPLAGAALAFGAAIELIQPSVGRTADWADLAADALGILAGLVPGGLLWAWRTVR